MENKITDLLRQELGSISLEDIRKLESKKLTEDDLKIRAADIELCYKNWLEDLILMIYWEQLKNVALTSGQLAIFKQGVLEGIVLIKDKLEQEAGISLSRFDKPEEPPSLEEI